MENPAPKPLFGKIPEEAFDHVQPGCTGRCEVHMKARVALQPVDDFLMFVRGVVVANDMDLFVFRHGTFDLIEKPDPFLMTMLRHTGPDNRAVQRIERGEHRGRPVAFVVVGEGAAPPLLQR